MRAYHILGRRCIQLVSDIARAAGYGNKILHVFDQGNSAWPNFEASFDEAMLDQLRIFRPTSQSRKDIPALQSADILAHQLGREKTAALSVGATHQRLYTNRLSKKPGISLDIGRGELLNAYYEEKSLEEARAEGRTLQRGFRTPLSEYHAELAREIFRIGGYPFDGRLRELQ